MEKIRKAIADKSIIKITDQDGRVRFVEPYALFIGKDSILLHCYQVAGYSSSPEPTGWRNLKVVQITSTQILGSFIPRKEFNANKLQGIIK